jgi:hypothetical protein
MRFPDFMGASINRRAVLASQRKVLPERFHQSESSVARPSPAVVRSPLDHTGEDRTQAMRLRRMQLARTCAMAKG